MGERNSEVRAAVLFGLKSQKRGGRAGEDQERVRQRDSTH